MNKPGVVTVLLGNQAVAATALIGTAIGGLAWVVGLVPLPLVFVAFGMAIICARAHASVKAYKAWHAQWNALDEPAPETAPARTPATGPRGNRALVVMLVSWLVLVFTVKTPGQKAGLVYFTLGMMLYGIVALVMRARRRRNGARATSPAGGQDDRVAICITQPVVPVPHLRDAYMTLPPYCHALFAGAGQNRGSSIP